MAWRTPGWSPPLYLLLLGLLPRKLYRWPGRYWVIAALAYCSLVRPSFDLGGLEYYLLVGLGPFVAAGLLFLLVLRWTCIAMGWRIW